MDLDTALAGARATQQSVLVATKRDGRPQLSNVLHSVGADGVIRISITADRAKYHNLKRDPWAALHVNGPNFWSYAVLEGEVELSALASAPDDPTVEELVTLYRSLAGEHADWDDYRAAMVSERRVVARFTPSRAYGTL
ncbi:MAG: PPOX class F420-dependent oxidoreductase [Propionibacteriaceae bacterium]